jgi:dihydrolipoamide dehydrogenase
MKKNKITVVMGTATLPGGGGLGEDRQGHRDADRQAHHSGHRRAGAELPGLEADGKLVWSYKHALVADRMPKSLLVIGSGAIGIEFASFFNLWAPRYHGGRGDGPHPAGGRRRNQRLREEGFEKQGMKILEKAAVKKLDRKPGVGVTAHIEQDGKITTPSSTR